MKFSYIKYASTILKPMCEEVAWYNSVLLFRI